MLLYNLTVVKESSVVQSVQIVLVILVPKCTNLLSFKAHDLHPMVSFPTLHQPLLIPFFELISLVFELLLDTLQVCLHHIHFLLHFFFFLFGLFQVILLLKFQLLLLSLLLHEVTLPDAEGFVVVHLV